MHARIFLFVIYFPRADRSLPVCWRVSGAVWWTPLWRTRFVSIVNQRNEATIVVCSTVEKRAVPRLASTSLQTLPDIRYTACLLLMSQRENRFSLIFLWLLPFSCICDCIGRGSGFVPIVDSASIASAPGGYIRCAGCCSQVSHH